MRTAAFPNRERRSRPSFFASWKNVVSLIPAYEMNLVAVLLLQLFARVNVRVIPSASIIHYHLTTIQDQPTLFPKCNGSLDKTVKACLTRSVD